MHALYEDRSFPTPVCLQYHLQCLYFTHCISTGTASVDVMINEKSSSFDNVNGVQDDIL
jgi:hypothetical protein